MINSFSMLQNKHQLTSAESVYNSGLMQREILIMDEPRTTFEPTEDEAITRAIIEARSQAAAGQTIPLRDVADWLDSWGTPNERPAPSPR